MVPELGMVVLFCGPDGLQAPALVVKVLDALTVNLHVFIDGDLDDHGLPGPFDAATAAVTWRRAVPYSWPPKPGHWCWPRAPSPALRPWATVLHVEPPDQPMCEVCGKPVVACLAGDNSLDLVSAHANRMRAERDELLAALKDLLVADETWEHEAQAKARAIIARLTPTRP